MIVRGRVVSGAHEAWFFVLLSRYQRFFRELLGFGPYPGTLNVLLNRPIRLRSYYKPDSGRTIRRARVRRINNVPVNAIAVSPGKHMTDKLELVSPVNLRRLLGLEDGSEVTIYVEEEK